MSSRASLNHIFRTVWNHALGAMVAVAEITSSGGRSKGALGRSQNRLQAHPLTGSSLAALSLGIAIAWGAVPINALANPSGGVAIVGQASMVNQGNKLTVTTQNGAGSNYSAINWQSFSIPAGSATYFQQPNAASTSINRVVTNTPSILFGTLGSNGNLVLVNQSGIAVGTGAVVDTAGFTASSLRMSDADALAGRLRFGDGSASAAGVSVQGNILARSGDVVLLGTSVDTGKDALIQAPNGSTILAAGRQIELTGRGLEGITLQVQAPTDAAVNLGTLQGGAVGIFAGTLKHSGLIQATTANLEGGKVVLKASGDAYVEGAGKILATGTVGGSVDVLGNRVAVTDQAVIDVSGEQGGGSVRVGGDYQGKNPDIQNANVTYFGPQASIKADAIAQGDGGKVIVWADDTTRAYGSISARGGQQGGNGGFVETSGHLYLDANGVVVDTSAPRGQVGIWLLDPTNIYIADQQSTATTAGMSGTDTSVNSSNPPMFQAAGSVTDSLLTTGTLQFNLGYGSVVVSTANGSGGGVGDIKVVSPVTWSNGNSLTLNADGNINVNANITGASGQLSLLSGTGVTSTAAIEVNKLEAVASTNGSINLPGLNKVSTFAASAPQGSITLENSAPGGLTIGSVGSTTGLDSRSGANVSQVPQDTLLTVANIINSIDYGNVTLTADNMAINADITGYAAVTLQPSKGGTLIKVGGSSNLNSAGVLGLNNTALSHVAIRGGSNSYLTIGSATSGDIEVVNPGATMPLAVANTTTLQTGGKIVVNGPLTSTYSDLYLDSGGDQTLNAAVTASGASALVYLHTLGTYPAAGNIGQNSAGTITAKYLAVDAAGTVDLSLAPNSVSNLAASVGGSFFKFNNVVPLVVTMDGDGCCTNGVNGITVGDGGGTLTLSTAGAVTQDTGSSAAINASKLELLATGAGAFALDNASNSVGTLAVNSTSAGPISFTRSNSTLTVGTVNSTIGVASAGNVSLTNSSGNIIIDSPVTLDSNAMLTINSSGSIGGSGLITANDITLQGDGSTGAIGDLEVPLHTQATSVDYTSTISIGNSDMGPGAIYLNHTGDATLNFVTQTYSATPVSINATGNLTTSSINTGNADLTMNSGGTLAVNGSLTATNISLTGVGVTNNSTITGPGGVTINAGTGTLTNTVSTGTISNNSTANAINLTGDTMALAGTITGGSGAVSLTTSTPGTAITIGTGGSGLGLSNAELQTITTSGTLTIGDVAHTGTLTADGAVTGVINPSGPWVLQTNGGTIGLSTFAVTTPGNLTLSTTGSGGTAGAVNGTGALTVGAAGAGNLTVNSAAGIGLSNVGNLANAVTLTNSTSGNIVYDNNRNMTLTASNSAANGTITVVNGGTGTLDTSGAITTAGTGAADISLQTAGLLTTGNAVTAAGTGTVSLTGGGVTNTSTVTGPGGVAINAGTGVLSNAGGGVISNGSIGRGPIVLIGDTMNLTGGHISATNSGTGINAGQVTLDAYTTGRGINLGTTEIGKLNLLGSDLQTITAGQSITVGGYMVLGSPGLYVSNGRAISVDGEITSANLSGFGAFVLANSAGSIDVNAPLTYDGSLLQLFSNGGGVVRVAAPFTAITGAVYMNGTSVTNSSAVSGLAVNLAADTLSLVGGTITAGAGGAYLMPNTTTGSINLGSTVANTLSLLGSDLQTITSSGGLHIGDALNPRGGITVAGPITATNLAGVTGPVYLDSKTGPIAVNAALTLPGSAYLTAPTVTIASSGAVNTTAGTININASSGLTNAGTLSGSGTITVGTGTAGFTNQGIISPGGTGAAGTLAVTGDLQLASSSNLKMEMGGILPGQSDKLTVTGNISTAGTVTASTLPGYTPSNADAIPFLTMGGTASGTFSAPSLPTGFSVGYNLATGEAARFIYASGPGTDTFTNASGGLDWAVAGNWSMGSLPGSADTALISSGNMAVTHNTTANDSIAALTINSNNSLNVSGGSLAVSGITTLGGALTVSGTGSAALSGALNGASTSQVNITGGSLNLGGTSSVNALNMSGGTLIGAGNVSVTNSFSQSGGNINKTGSLSINQASGALSIGNMTADVITLTAPGGDLTLNSGATLSAHSVGNALVMATNGNFINNAGASVLTTGTGGRWLVYAPSPSSVTKGGLIPTLYQYNTSWGGTAATTGSGFIYASPLYVDANFAGTLSSTYGTSPTATPGYSLRGLDAGDSIAAAAITGSANYSNWPITALTGAGSYSLQYVSGLSPAALPYSLTAGTSQTYTVNPANIVIINVGASLIGDARKTYDGTTNANLTPSNFLLSGFVNSDYANVTKNTGSYASRNVGSGILVSTTLTPSDFNPVGSTNLANYLLPSLASGNIGNITPASLSVTANNATKTYDRVAYSGGNGVSYSGFVNSETAAALGGTLTYSGTSQGAINAGSYLITPGGLNSGNYSFNYVNGTLIINPASAAISLTGTRSYDGTNIVNASIFSLSGLVGSETLTLTGSGTVADKNVGLNKPVSLGSLTLGNGTTGLASNYTFTGGTQVATITPALISSVSGISANNKVYNGNTNASLNTTSVTFAGAIGGDSLSVAGTGVFSDKNVGLGKTVTVTGLSLSGTDASNYTLGSSTATTSADISKATITGMSGISANNKVYDGTTAATVNTASATLVGAISGDSLNVSGANGAFSDKNAGLGKTVSITGIALAGTDAGNYTLVKDTATAQADISRAPLTGITGMAVNDKVYDGKTTATLTTTGASFAGLVSGDNVTVGAVTAAFVDRNVGVGKAVNITSLALTGTDAGNYSLGSSTASTTGTITVRPLSTWTASGSGQWSMAGNWDALPDGSNVLAVSIPAGVSVSYDAAVASTSLQALNSAGALALAGGSLSIAGSLTTPQYSQTGGALGGAGSLNVNGSFSQTGGTIAMGGPVSIIQSVGNLSVGSVNAAAISLSAPSGSIGQSAGLVTSGLLATQSSGATVLNDPGNRISSFRATTSGPGNVELTNVGALDVQGISTANGNITLVNTGGISTSGTVLAGNGAVTMTSNSPLTIGTAGVAATNDITLTATNLTSAGNMTLDGPLSSSAGGIALTAANNFVQNSTLTAALGINVSAGGTMTFGPFAMSTGHPVNYVVGGVPLAPPWIVSALGAATSDFVASFASQFQDALVSQAFDSGDPLGQRKRDKDGIVVEGQLCSR